MPSRPCMASTRASTQPLTTRRPRLLQQPSRQRCPTVRVNCSATAAFGRTHYDVLGIRETASVRDIKDAFRRLALMWHPDRCKQPGAKDKFMELKTAYDTLVDLTTRSKYDQHLQQAMAPRQPPSQPAGPGPVGYDWSKYRTASVRRTSSVRKPPQQPAAGFASAAVPPRPHARSSSGDDYDAGFSAFRSPSATSAHSGAGAAGRAASTASTSGYGGAGGGGGSAGYRSIFGNDTSEHGFTRVASSNQHRAQTPPAYSRSSSIRSNSRTRYGRSSTPQRSGSTSAWSARAASPTPAQQWHSMYCHSGDDMVAASGTTHAATTALARITAASAISSSSSTVSGEPWHRHVSGDGFTSTALVVASASAPALPQPVDHATAWRSAAAAVGGGDDYVQNQHALVKVEQKSGLPVKVTPAWDRMASFISVRMS